MVNNTAMGEQANSDSNEGVFIVASKEETSAKKRKPESCVQHGEPIALTPNQAITKRMRPCLEQMADCGANKTSAPSNRCIRTEIAVLSDN